MIPNFNFQPYTAPYAPPATDTLASAIESKNLRWERGEQTIDAVRDLGMFDADITDKTAADWFAGDLENKVSQLLKKYDGQQGSNQFQREAKMLMREGARAPILKELRDSAEIKKKWRDTMATQKGLVFDQSTGMEESIISGWNEDGSPILQRPQMRIENMLDPDSAGTRVAQDVISRVPTLDGYSVVQGEDGKSMIINEKGRSFDITNENDPVRKDVIGVIEEFYLDQYINESNPTGNQQYRRELQEANKAPGDKTPEEIEKIARDRITTFLLTKMGSLLSTSISEVIPGGRGDPGGRNPKEGFDGPGLAFRGALNTKEVQTVGHLIKAQEEVANLEHRKNRYLEEEGITLNGAGEYTDVHGVSMTEDVEDHNSQLDEETLSARAFVDFYNREYEKAKADNPNYVSLGDFNPSEEELQEHYEERRSAAMQMGLGLSKAGLSKDVQELRLKELKNIENPEYIKNSYYEKITSRENARISQGIIDQANAHRNGLAGLNIPLLNISGVDNQTDVQVFEGIRTMLPLLPILDEDGNTLDNKELEEFNMSGAFISFEPNGTISLNATMAKEGNQEIKNIKITGEDARGILNEKYGNEYVTGIVKEARQLNTLNEALNYLGPKEARGIDLAYLRHHSFLPTSDGGAAYNKQVHNHLSREFSDVKIIKHGENYFVKKGEESTRVGSLQELDGVLSSLVGPMIKNFQLRPVTPKARLSEERTLPETIISSSQSAKPTYNPNPTQESEEEVEYNGVDEYVDVNGNIKYPDNNRINLKVGIDPKTRKDIPIESIMTKEEAGQVKRVFVDGVNDARLAFESSFGDFLNINGVDSKYLTDYFYNMISAESNGNLKGDNPTSEAYGLIQLIGDNRIAFNKWYKKGKGVDAEEIRSSNDPLALTKLAMEELSWFYTEADKTAVNRVRTMAAESSVPTDSLLYLWHHAGGTKIGKIFKDWEDGKIKDLDNHVIYKAGSAEQKVNLPLVGNDKTRDVKLKDIFNHFNKSKVI